MSFSSHDKSKEIAAILCPYLRDKSPKTPFRVLTSGDDELFATVYRDLLTVGGRKGLFESRKDFVVTVLLHNEGFPIYLRTATLPNANPSGSVSNLPHLKLSRVTRGLPPTQRRLPRIDALLCRKAAVKSFIMIARTTESDGIIFLVLPMH